MKNRDVTIANPLKTIPVVKYSVAAGPVLDNPVITKAALGEHWRQNVLANLLCNHFGVWRFI